MSDSGVKDPQLALKRLMRVWMAKLVAAKPQLEDVEARSKPEIVSLVNLLEQTGSVQATGSEVSLMTHFPDLTHRLMVKLSEEVHRKAQLLRSLIEPYHRHQLALDKALAEGRELCRKFPDDLNVKNMSQGEATVPPSAMMLMWISKAEKLMREIYYCRAHYLDDLLEFGYARTDALSDSWAHSVPELMDALTDCREQTSFLLEEEID